jgi:single-stranded-DNA-specific exonuclease
MADSDLASDELVLGVKTSLKGRTWIARLKDDRLAVAHAQRLGLPEVVGRVLAGREVALDDAKAFLNPSLKYSMPDPSVLRDLSKAVERLALALDKGEQVAVFGDYDVDGATSSALLKRFFDQISVPLEIYIPDRQKEGYGPNAPALRKLKEAGMDVVITVDCGATSFEALEAGKDIGLDVIVADHHQMSLDAPVTAALINPNHPEDISGLGQLAAVGVTFFLLVGLNRHLRESGYYKSRAVDPPDLMNLLDLVALGTICDVVPLTGINRVLVAQGLKVMGQRSNVGIAALADTARVSERLGTYHAGFVIGPRINAGGRVGRSDLGSRLLSSQDASEAQGIAYELDRLNKERREIEAKVQASAMGQAERLLEEGEPKVLIVAQEGWHPGVIGIVASRLKDKFGRPCFVIAIDEAGLGKGSGRSISGVDLGAGVASAVSEGLLVNGGGHKMAAGLTVNSDNLPSFISYLDKFLGSQVDLARSQRGYKIDAVLTPSSASRELVDQIEQVGPFGAGNPEPIFALASAQIVRADLVGENHVRCILTGAGKGSLKAIAFRSSDTPLGAALMAGDGRKLHLAGRLRADNWQGRKDVQFTIEDGVVVGD